MTEKELSILIKDILIEKIDVNDLQEELILILINNISKIFNINSYYSVNNKTKKEVLIKAYNYIFERIKSDKLIEFKNNNKELFEDEDYYYLDNEITKKRLIEEHEVKTKEYFKEVESIDGFINKLFSDDHNIEIVNNRMFFDDVLKEAIESLKNIKKDISKEKEFIELLHKIDSKLNSSSSRNQNRYHKIPTILASAIYIDKYEKEFKIYSDEEKVAISRYSVFEMLDTYQNINKLFPKDIMKTIVSKNKDWQYHFEYMIIVDLYRNKFTSEEIINYIYNTDDKELIREASYIEEDLGGLKL